MSLPLDQLIRDLAQYLNSPLDIARGVYSLAVPVGNGRFQYISATIRPDHEGHEIIDFVSTVGEATGRVDPWQLLARNDRTLFCRIAVAKGMIFVVASQLQATAQPQEVLLMLREVAMVGDQLEQELFRGDAH